MEEKPKAYVLCTKTFREIENLAKNSVEYKVELYSHEIDRSDLSEEQRKIQMKNHWYTTVSNDFRLWDMKLEDMVKNKITNSVSNKYKDNIQEKALNDILDTEVRFLAKVERKDKDRINVTTYQEIGDEHSDRYEYHNDIKEFEELAKKATKNASYSGDGEIVYLEKVAADVYVHSFNDLTKTITKAINKYIRNNLTYCLKNGKLIIPDEYLDKGERGVEEWRNIKSSSNKSNSIENKLIKDAINEKKQYAYDCVNRAMDKVLSAGDSHDWTIPRLTIDGKYNRQRTQKLAAKVLGTKDKQKLIEMSEQEIINRAKAYWKQKLMDAYNEVDKLEV